jgi:GDP/UDP-N,N'-diacetylbacillosamine 2-epimerase (hydrolysing)
MAKKIAIITGNRSEWGLLKPLTNKLNEEYNLFLISTGEHVKGDDFYKIITLLNSDSSDGVNKSMALTILGLTDHLSESKPDAVLLLGDRYETLAAAITAYNLRIPIIHLHGGEITEGSLDDVYRKAIVAMTDIEFSSDEDSAILSEVYGAKKAFEVGAIGADVGDVKPMKHGYDIVAVLHPARNLMFNQMLKFFKALKEYRESVIFIKSNCDAGGGVINEYIDKNGFDCYTSLPRDKYLSLLKGAKVLVGNSSSGIFESPSLGIPVVNIGDRQKGRKKAKCVIDCKFDITDINNSVKKCLSKKWKGLDFKNPYYRKGTLDNIVKIIKEEL